MASVSLSINPNTTFLDMMIFLGLYIYGICSAFVKGLCAFGHMFGFLANVCLKLVFFCIDGCMSDQIICFSFLTYCYISWFGYLSIFVLLLF